MSCTKTAAEAVERACSLIGGQAALAKTIGVKPPTVHQWRTGTRPVPIVFSKSIEDATSGAVTRQELRPVDWHLIWPELAGPESTSHKDSINA